MSDLPPSGWRESPLREAAVVRVSPVDKKLSPREPEVWLCNYMDVYANRNLGLDHPYARATASRAEKEAFGLRKGDVIITKDSETPDDIAVPAVVRDAPSDLVCGYHLAILRPNQQVADPIFLREQIRHERLRAHFAREATGSTRYGLRTASIEGAPLLLPSLAEQRRIAEVLDTIDRAISTTEQIVQKLSAVKQGLVHDLLTRGIDERGELRDPERHPERFMESELGPVPTDWEVRALGGLSQTYAGGTPSRSVRTFWGGTVNWVKSGELNQDTIWSTEERITERAVALSSAKWVEPGTPLMAMYGATAGAVAWLAVRGTTNQAVLAVPGSAAAHPRWVFWALRHASRRIVGTVQGSGQPNLSKTTVDRAMVAVPRSLREQAAICRILDGCLLRIAQERSFLRKLGQARDGLLDDLLTGRVRLAQKSPTPRGVRNEQEKHVG